MLWISNAVLFEHLQRKSQSDQALAYTAQDQKPGPWIPNQGSFEQAEIQIHSRSLLTSCCLGLDVI